MSQFCANAFSEDSRRGQRAGIDSALVLSISRQTIPDQRSAYHSPQGCHRSDRMLARQHCDFHLWAGRYGEQNFARDQR